MVSIKKRTKVHFYAVIWAIFYKKNLYFEAAYKRKYVKNHKISIRLLI